MSGAGLGEDPTRENKHQTILNSLSELKLL